ncbi:hypothetical protein IC229_13585 [Spirosoma sp. BT702]|uniref:DUF3592 domain-containing protein n=1 Tax=Spirosoma profusum TaxID=2771354 RepID=A0A926XW49_9BACT|nr:DUF3592 domain-containing protein [Spirosoma profusum]MBD2701677.1 hypothetical protein [Spirosoma profusum]
MNAIDTIFILILAGYGAHYAFTLGRASSELYKEMMRIGAFAQGRISRIREKRTNGAVKLFPTIVFDVDGTVYEEEVDATTDIEQLKVGQSLQVYYVRESPTVCSWVGPSYFNDKSFYYYAVSFILGTVAFTALKVLFALL